MSTDYPHDLTVDEVAAMQDRLDRHRKSRIWFGPDWHLCDSLNEATRALQQVMSDLAVEGHNYRRPNCEGDCCGRSRVA